jgi:hypothetical protein
MVGSKALELIYKIKKARGLKVTEIYMGGGGNEEDSCRAMCLNWIDSFARAYIARGTEPDLASWERLNP